MSTSSEQTSISIIDPVGGHGGMEFYDTGLMNGLIANGAKVSLYTCEETPVKLAKGEVVKIFGDVWKRKGINKLIKYLFSYRKAFKLSGNADAIHLHFFQIGWLNLVVLFLARKYSFQKVLTVHDVDPFVGSASNFVHKWTYKLVDTIIVHNEFSKAELLKKPIDASKIIVKQHGNYLSFFSEKKATKSINEFNLLFFGQIKDVKGLDVLIEAFAIAIKVVPQLRLTIAGRPWKSDWSKYDALITNLGVKEFIDLQLRYIDNGTIPDLFSQADAVVLPYRRIYQSGVMILSMGFRKPIIASDLAPFQELITDHKNGLLFKNGDPFDLAEKLIFCASNPADTNVLGSNAFDLVSKDFDWIKLTQDYLDIYRRPTKD